MKKANGLSHLKVLFIDDDHLLRRAMATYFRKRVARFLTLGNAEAAIEQVEENPFDVVICDQRLPGMDGIEFFERLGMEHPGLRRILVSAYADGELEERSREMGIDRFVSKPFDGEKIGRVMAGE